MGSVNYGNAYSEPRPLLRHGSSIFSLTADDVQNSFGDPGANFGSMNMDDFLKNIWTLEESQAMVSAMNPGEGLNRGLSTQFSLQKQGSFGLPRTLSTKAAEDLWKAILSQHQGNPEAVGNHQRQIGPEVSLVKAEAGKERKPHVEVTLEDFLVKAGIARDGPIPNLVSSNQGLMASGNQVPINQMQQLHANSTMGSSSQAQQVPTRPFLTPPNQQHHGSVDHTLTPSNQVKQQMSPIRGHPQASPIQSTLTPSNPLPSFQQTAPNMSSPFLGRAPAQQAFMGFGGFPISRNDGEFENRNSQVAPNNMNNFVPPVANATSCPPSSGKAQLDALNGMFVSGQQSEWMNNPYGKPVVHQKQLVQRQAIAESPSALCNVANASSGPSVESSPGRLSPLGGGFGAALGTGGLGLGGLGMNRGGNTYPARISFGPCSPLSAEFDDGSPDTSNLPLSMISEFGNGQLQRKKRCVNPPIERVIERRQRRMIKNRESAARSRARKQAYTVELEAEVSQLKEENMELLRKQEEEAALRKKQILALMPSTPEMSCKGRYLKRTHTGPW